MNLNAKTIKEQVSLVGLLSKLGYHPVDPNGKELLYFSMLRIERTPNFSVDKNLDAWYDHGMGKGGDVVDFGLAYWKLSLRETLQKISDLHSQPLIHSLPPKRVHANKVPHYRVEVVKELGTNPVITSYLQQRGIWQTAQGCLKEVYYYVEDEKKVRKPFFAAGWQNETGSWEVRNKFFKTCIGHKGISIIPGDGRHLSIFECKFSYLSWLTENKPKGTIIVLNSTAMLQVALTKAKEFHTIDLFFDRNRAGHSATQEFLEQIPGAIDRSYYYEGHNDYNDKITARLKIPKNDIFQHAFLS